MWKPREPDVFGHAERPASVRTSGDERDVDDLLPLDAGHRVQVDAQLGGVLEVLSQDWVRVEVHAAEVDDPSQPGLVAHDDLGRRGPRRVVQLSDLQPLRPRGRGPLLEHRLLANALDEPLEDHRPAGDPAQRPLGNRQVVADQVQLGVPGVGEHDLVLVGDHNLAPAQLEHLLPRRRHADRLNRDRPRRPARPFTETAAARHRPAVPQDRSMRGTSPWRPLDPERRFSAMPPDHSASQAVES